jgi:hypothetical protein
LGIFEQNPELKNIYPDAQKSLLNIYEDIDTLSINDADQKNEVTSIIDRLQSFFREPYNFVEREWQRNSSKDEWTQILHIQIAALNLSMYLALSDQAHDSKEVKSHLESVLDYMLFQHESVGRCWNNTLAKSLMILYLMMPIEISDILNQKIQTIKNYNNETNGRVGRANSEFLEKLLVNSRKLLPSLTENGFPPQSQVRLWNELFRDRKEVHFIENDFEKAVSLAQFLFKAK